ncbi:prolipoprotein diacylglyceryl transferase family protein [Sporomusa carbonis]
MAWRYFRRRGLSFRRFADIAAPRLILGQAIGRIGLSSLGQGSPGTG